MDGKAPRPETPASRIVGLPFPGAKSSTGLAKRSEAALILLRRAPPCTFEAFARWQAVPNTRAGSIPIAPQDLHLHHTVMQQVPSARTPTEVLAGLVERVTFHNEENGFCVLRVKARGQRDLITVLGHAAMIAAGEFVQASGSWIDRKSTRLNSSHSGESRMPSSA